MTSLLSIVLILAQAAAPVPRPATVKPAKAAAAPAPADQIEVVLYSDFQCPFCAQFAKPFREFQAKGVEGVKTRVTFKNFPLSIHPKAQLAHQAAMAARQQGKFWQMHDLLFANLGQVDRAHLLEYATRLGLDMARFEKDLDSPRTKQLVAADLADGAKVGVRGTPTYTINGKLYSGTRSFEQLKQLALNEHRKTRALAEITDGLLTKGPADAAVTVELFADLASPVTRQAVEVLNDLMRRQPSTVRVQFRNFPLSFHPQAALAHEAAMTAAKHGRFWEFAECVLSHQESLREQDLIAFAGQVGLGQTAFAETLRDHRYAPRVEADVQSGAQRGIRGSPVMLVNGKRIDGVPSIKALTELVEAALAATRGR
jgi:protein-disulfide isomerase